MEKNTRCKRPVCGSGMFVPWTRGGRFMVSLLLLLVFMSSCTVSRHLPEGALLLDKVDVLSEEEPELASSLKSRVRQHPNTRTFGLVRLPMRIYLLAGTKDNAVNRMIKNLGEAPHVYDAAAAEASSVALEKTLVNRGYLKAKVEVDTTVRRRKVEVDYHVTPGRMYTVASVRRQSMDTALLRVVRSDTVSSLLRVGMPLDASLLADERTRLTEYLRNIGYYDFKKENITFVVDTSRNSYDVDLTMRIRVAAPGQPFRRFTIGKVDYQVYPSSRSWQSGFALPDTISWGATSFMYDGDMPLRPRVVAGASLIKPGMPYSTSAVTDSYVSYGRFAALKYAHINFTESNDSTLNCHIALHPARKVSTGLETDFTHTAGDLGVSASLSFTNRNLFRGSEVFTLKLRGAYENITHLADYDSGNYWEYGVDMSLGFPRFIVPFVSDRVQRQSRATTQLDLQYNTQRRPEFDRDVFSASWSYHWDYAKRTKHRLDLLGINFVSVPRINSSFVEEYLNKYNGRNSILRFNYEDLFIFRTGYDFQYASSPVVVVKDRFSISHSVRAGVETAGNFLNLASRALKLEKDSLGQYRVLGLAYAQYLKGDFAWTMNMNFNRRHSLLLHMEAGVAYPYGNARMLPFEKRYYAGGANGVRGWSVRELGPGSYVSPGGTIDYINHSGDIKLDCSIEYRSQLFWKLGGALFVDAGNIWTIHEYDDQPGGMFYWDTFYKQIAVAYGVGLRVDLNFLVLRFDVAMKAINPAYTEGTLRYPVLKPDLRRDFAWHFAVGYPF